MKKSNFGSIGLILLSFSLFNVFDVNANDVPEKVNISKKVVKKQKQSQSNISLKDLTNNGIKDIEVNSVNFIKLKNKANEVFITNPDIVDVQMLSDNSLYLIGLAPGITSVVINDKRGNIMVDCKVRVTHPVKAIKAAIMDMYPESDIDIVSIDKSIILRGRVPSPEVATDAQAIAAKFVESDNIINKLTVQTSAQVLLKVKIAEVSRELTKSLGVSWRAVSAPKSLNGMAYGFAGGNSSNFFEKIADTDELTEKLLSADGILASDKNSRWLMHSSSGNSFSGLIDALASESFASILAEPTIMALSGKTAKFEVGGEYGYTVTQPGDNITTTEFKDWGTSVEFTPVVLSEDRINITVSPKVSTIEGSDTTKAPSLTTKEASTTVELGSGQSLAIAGLLQTNTNTSSNETPFLADIPFIGALFRNSNVTKTERELVIIVTPYVVKPSSKPLKAPTDMVPKMLSPLESILARKFHKRINKVRTAGFSIK
ncbi:MAG: type II and III secretion system protein family protein [Alphaproteobacteria bacterium]|nr:type II and III secretion system protein family protein [Alphaproteobacteria bacterium]